MFNSLVVERINLLEIIRVNVHPKLMGKRAVNAKKNKYIYINIK